MFGIGGRKHRGNGRSNSLEHIPAHSAGDRLSTAQEKKVIEKNRKQLKKILKKF